MGPDPAPGRTMVPLVPALVMLGLVAGAHGDSKYDVFRCSAPRPKGGWHSSQQHSGLGTGPLKDVPVHCILERCLYPWRHPLP